METLLIISIAVTTVAVVIQAGILVALFLGMRQRTGRIEALAAEVKTKAIPAIETVHSLLVELHPKLTSIADNLQHSTQTLREQVERVDATVNDVLDRTRLQVIRADELLHRTLDRVEETSDTVHRTVISPVRQLSGLVQGITATLEFLLGNRKRQPRDGQGVPRAVPQDEMFI